MIDNPGALARLEEAATELVQPRVLVGVADLRTVLAALASEKAALVRADEALIDVAHSLKRARAALKDQTP